MASRLNAAGVRNVRGFSVNVSNYYTTSASVTYANAVNSALGYAAPLRRSTPAATATAPTASGATRPAASSASPPQVGGGAEMLLWVKTPGNSDGECGIAPTTPAGQFNPAIAIRLIDGV